MEKHIGKTIADRYRLIEKIGAGGMGAVYLVEDLMLKREVVLKMLLPTLDREEETIARFLREANLLSKLNHPNIVTIHDSGNWQGISFIILEYLKGKNLEDILLEKGTLPISWIKTALYQILDALEAAHRAGIIHRDLKPSNIFCREEPGQVCNIKILDFGAAIPVDRDAYEKITVTGDVIGTPVYMSPEQIMGRKDISPGSDIYSLGIILYEMICGVPPFISGNKMSIVLGHLYKTPEPILWPEEKDSRHDRLQRVINTCLSKSPEDRYSSIRELREALETEPEDKGRLPENLTGDRQNRYKEYYQGPIIDTQVQDTTAPPAPAPGPRLLVFEAENLPVEHSITPLLKMSNYAVESPTSFDRESLESLEAPQAIILNYGKEENLQLFKETLKVEKLADVPVFVCGPEGDFDYISQVIELGAGDYLSYPFDPGEVKTKIDRV